MDVKYALNKIHRHTNRTPPHLKTHSHTATCRAACAPEVPMNNMWGHPEVATLTTMWVEELEKELPAIKIDDKEFKYSMHTWLLHLCHDCGNHECQKTHHTWYKTTIFSDKDFYEHSNYLAGITYFKEYNQDVQLDTLIVA